MCKIFKAKKLVTALTTSVLVIEAKIKSILKHFLHLIFYPISKKSKNVQTFINLVTKISKINVIALVYTAKLEFIIQKTDVNFQKLIICF